jgi:hypothetical protein
LPGAMTATVMVMMGILAGESGKRLFYQNCFS